MIASALGDCAPHRQIDAIVAEDAGGQKLGWGAPEQEHDGDESRDEQRFDAIPSRDRFRLRSMTRGGGGQVDRNWCVKWQLE